MLKPFSGEKACPSEQQCGEEGWAEVVTKTVHPILNTKCQVERSKRKLQRFCYDLFSSASVCLQAVEITVVLVSFGHKIGFVSLLEHWHRTNIHYL